MEDIDPASGHDISERAYQSSRASWVWTIKQHGWAPDYRPHSELPEVFAQWQRRRPDLTAADSADAWLADGIDAHRAYWAAPARSCNVPSCDLHAPSV